MAQARAALPGRGIYSSFACNKWKNVKVIREQEEVHCRGGDERSLDESVRIGHWEVTCNRGLPQSYLVPVLTLVEQKTRLSLNENCSNKKVPAIAAQKIGDEIIRAAQLSVSRHT